MSVLEASPLHLVSGLINAPLFHRDLQETPPEVTVQCIRLLTQLAQDEIFAYHANHEMVSFLSSAIDDRLDDQTYVLVATDFVRRLQTILSPSDPIWGAIAFVMSSVASRFSEGDDRLVWTKICALFFDVLQVEGVINERDAHRLMKGTKSGQGYEELEQEMSAAEQRPKSPDQPRTEEELRLEEEAERKAALRLLGGGSVDHEFERRLKKLAES